VRVVSHPEFMVTVETVDKVTQTPLSGARVVMHPYKATTDERGVAEVPVAKGAYRLFVSQTGYLTFGLPVEVTANLTARAELDLEPVTERN
jgi:capsular polysaccharide biosynthesis protein